MFVVAIADAATPSAMVDAYFVVSTAMTGTFIVAVGSGWCLFIAVADTIMTLLCFSWPVHSL